ncbi:glycosyltransferase family 2 protein [Alicyclobacillus sp. SO9]|uniref:glycosyltransferase n=1 Tax=Alicyclobacillus sp. SO9 TaxID=2665646 RepID=UPI001E4302B2|nr:glycosyltransferase family 2 protein [Alicyclobacillus sp. SO9]
MWLWLLAATTLTAWMIFTILSFPGLKRAVALKNSHVSAEWDCKQPSRAALDLSGSSAEDDQNRLYSQKVSLILAARNEAQNLPHTLSSLREQTWANLEVIVVDDRSIDNTRRVLKEASHNWPQLKVIYNTTLPEGWLGKTYALWTAARQANGKWLLFTDADVAFTRDAVETAMKYVTTRNITHLALSPRIIAKGFWLRSVVYFFLYNVVLAFRPQNADSSHSSASVGIGAFNLIQKQAYDSVDGHRSVAMRTDEDLALGSVIKKAGFKQVFAGGTHLLSVEWYKTLSEMTLGLEKNALAPFHYRYWYFSSAMAAMLLFYSGPAVGTILSAGWTRGIFALAWAMETYLFYMTRKYSGVSALWSITVPLSAPVLCCILVRAAMLTAVNGGIRWRDTFYSLRELRKQK